MVRKIFNFFIYLLFFIIAIIYFTPKIGLYYFAEQKLKPLSGVIISKEELRDNGFSLEIENANISAKGIDSAVIKSINIKLFGIYNSVSVQEIKLTSVADAFVPLNIDTLHIKYTVLNPLVITGDAKGGFGEASLELSLDPDTLKRHLKIILSPSKNMKQNYKRTLRNLKKNKEGVYIYEKNI